MLILNLAAVAKQPVRVEGVLAPDDPIWEDALVRLREPLQVRLEARSVGEGVLARGEMTAELHAECRRCLTEVDTRAELPLELYYEPLQGEDRQDWEGEIYPLPERGTELDLAPAIREQLLLQLPEYVVCRESCRGLCAQCGANLNEGECGCEPEEPESPWDALKQLKFD